MFSIGLGEIVVVLLAAVIFLNPKDLPKIASMLGVWYSKLKNIYNSASKMKEDTIGIIERELNSEKDNNADEIVDVVSEIKKTD